MYHKFTKKSIHKTFQVIMRTNKPTRNELTNRNDRINFRHWRG